MKIINKQIFLHTKKQFEIVDITLHVKTAAVESGVLNGQMTIFCPHTTASVRLNHNEELLTQDFMKALYRLAPVDQSYAHDLFEVRRNVSPGERTNGHAHVKSFLLGSSETLIMEKGEIILGKQQSIFFVELDGGREREVRINILGE
ncbi:MAG: secondary thiamine-phosphate synthase enzyme YjbQ [Patescibacteria group bacterium]